MKMKTITKDVLLEKSLENKVLWDTNEIIQEKNMETVVDKARIIGRLEMINELMDYLNETT